MSNSDRTDSPSYDQLQSTMIQHYSANNYAPIYLKLAIIFLLLHYIIRLAYRRNLVMPVLRVQPGDRSSARPKSGLIRF